MQFIWDIAKAESNLAKHKISFDEAKTIFADNDALLIYDPDSSDIEERFLLLGLSLLTKLLVVCHCYREKDQEIRIISARKANKKEISTYNKRKL